MPVLFVGAATKARAAPKRNTEPSIAGLPQDPPVFTAVPSTWSPTVTVTGFDAVEWAVFQVSTSGQYTSDMELVRVAKPSGAGSTWTFSPAAVIKNERDRLIVKNSFSAPTKEWVSGGAVLNLPPAASTGGKAHALAFKAGLTIGVNVERDQPILNGYMTTGRFQNYKDLGFTHARFAAPYGPWREAFDPNGAWPDVAGGGMDWWFEACERAMSVGLKILADCIDMIYLEEWGDSRIMPHIRACAERIASRGWDVNMYALGGAQEYGGGTNREHNPYMHETVRQIRAALPNSLIMIAGCYWNDPEYLAGFGAGDPNDPFTPPADDRVIVQWHKYAMEAFNLGTSEWYRDNLADFEQRTGLVTICGEYAMGPAANDNRVADQAYLRWPDVFHATSRGMWQQCPTYWCVTGDPNTHWRMTKAGTAELHDEIQGLAPEADGHIRGLAEWQALRDGSAGGGTTAPPPTGATVPGLEVLNRGQSNAYYGDSSGGAENLRAALASLTGLAVKMISRKETADDSTLHGGTYTYWKSPYNNDPRWLAPPNNDYASAPSGWTAQNAMQGTLNAVSRQVSADSSVPLLDLVLHWEYDLAMEDSASKAAYPNGSWEPARRIREARTKAAGKHVQFRGYCPYQSGSWNALWDIHGSWANDLANSSRNVFMACGNMMDANHRGDSAHWDDDSARRIYTRVAFTMAKHAWQQGWTAADLSDCPSRGPSMVSATRSGNSITVTVEHDRGTALVAGQDGTDWRAFLTWDANGNDLRGTGGAILTATTFRVDFGGTPAANGAISHAFYPDYYGRRLLRDNWHAAVPAKYAGVPNVGLVDFPLRRNTSTGIAFA